MTPVPEGFADRIAEDTIKWANDANWGYVDLPRAIIETVLAARGFQRLDHEREETHSASIISDRQTGDLIHTWTGPDGYAIEVHTATATSGREWTRIDATNGIREFACGARMIFGDDGEDEWREEFGCPLADDDDDDDDDRIATGDPTYVTLYKDDDFEVSVGTWPSGYMQYVTTEYRYDDRHVGGKWEFVEAARDPREFELPMPAPARAAMLAHWGARQ